MNLEMLKYPIGKFEYPHKITRPLLDTWISDIKEFPTRIAEEVHLLTDVQLEASYRPNGWTIRQLVHHCADSHMNSFIRIKLALTEDRPKVKPYSENRWAELTDVTNTPVKASLQIIEGVHLRWVTLLKSLSEEQMNKCFIHPEHGIEFTIMKTIGLYAWHGNHHLAHIRLAKADFA